MGRRTTTTTTVMMMMMVMTTLTVLGGAGVSGADAADGKRARRRENAQARIEWLGRAVNRASVTFWIKNSTGHYVAVNAFFADAFGFDDARDVVGFNDPALVQRRAGNLTIAEFANVNPGETFDSIAKAFARNDLLVQRTKTPTRFIERAFSSASDQARIINVISIKSPFAGGTVGLAIPVDPADDTAVTFAGTDAPTAEKNSTGP